MTEDPSALNYQTTYLYDVLGNVRKVTQGAQDRWFAYDSLSRLIRVKNPEQNANNSLPAYTDPVTGNSGWSMAYSYDANGNLAQRIDARGVGANYTYDGLNRNTGIDYVNGSQTRSVRMVYDGAVNGKGRLHYEWTQEGGVNATQTKIDNYDALGRPLNKQRSFWRGSDWGTPFVVQQGYNLIGAVETLTYPSGHVANYSHDQAGLLSSFSGNLGSGINQDYATGMQYDAAGAMKREQFGTTIPLYLRRHYNNRGQLFDIRNVNNKAYTVNAATNRLTSVDGVAMSYDAAGNQTNDGSGQRVYDGENRMVEAFNSAGVRVSWYVYDAEGRRVVRTVGAEGTWQVYGIGGELLAEYAVGAEPSAAQKEYGYRGGQLLVVWDGGETGDRQLQWLVQDHLGSTRMVVDRSGSLGGIRRHDFCPFGEELSAGVGIRIASLGYGADSTRQRYTGKERDAETGLDYFFARYYSNIQGRFTSVDPENAGAIEDDPQSWNAYAYARNAPSVYSDPDGREYRICSPDGKECYNHSDEQFDDARRVGRKDGFAFTGDGKYLALWELPDKPQYLVILERG